MRTLIYGTLLALSTIAYAEKPAVCNSPDLKPERRTVLCREAPKIKPVGELEVRLVCTDANIGKLSDDDRERLCPVVEPVAEEDLKFIDPRCESQKYFALPPAARRQIDCRVKSVVEFSPICQDYLTGKLSMPEELRERYCPDAPHVIGEGKEYILNARHTLEIREAEHNIRHNMDAAEIADLKRKLRYCD